MAAFFRPSSRSSFTVVLALLLASVIEYTHAWSIPTGESSSRRTFFQGAACNAAALLTGVTTAGVVGIQPAAAIVPTPDELERLRKGHARVMYLLDHWNEVTQICGTSIMSDEERKQVMRTEGGGGTDGCSKTPLRVQEFMGYKSTNDPLYRADKLMVRAGSLVDPDDFDKYLDQVEKWREKADNTALMAYTASWGEANP